MDIKQLFYFIETCKRMNLTATAEVLHITPQALSKSIQNMERELGAKLFHRGKNAFQLTEYGELLHRYALPIVEQFGSLQAEMGQLARQQRGHVRLSCIASMLPIFHDCVLHFLEQYPDIHLEILEMPDDEVEPAVLAQRVDLAICAGYDVRSPELASELLFQDSVGLVLRRDNPLFQKQELTVADLRGQTMVSHIDLLQVEQAIQRRCDALGFSLHYLLRSPSVELNKQVMRRFPCVSVGPHSLCSDFGYSSKVGYRPFAQSEGLSWSISLISLRGKYLGTASETFVQHLKNHFARLPFFHQVNR